MCGIVGGFRPIAIEAGSLSIAHRGPDGTGLWQNDHLAFAHRRLAIQDLSEASRQPLSRGEITICYNGELWNVDQLRRELREEGRTFTTTGDAEVVATALDEWDVGALKRFDGQFALAWQRAEAPVLYVARDPFGEVPLSIQTGALSPPSFASERKAFGAMGQVGDISDVVPGTWASYSRTGKIHEERWHDVSTDIMAIGIREAAERLRFLLGRAVAKRLIGDASTCVLLSGGIDSALIAAFAAERGVRTAYTAVMDRKSKDLARAREAAKMVGLNLVEVPVREPSDDDLKAVIDIIEMPHQAQVEIGWACLALAEAINKDGHKIVLSGEGADELFASYGFAFHGLQKESWATYRKRLIYDQCRKNFSRCNKIFMRRGVECRLPFVDRDVVQFCLQLPKDLVKGDSGKEEKLVLKDAANGLVPESVRSARKLAFQVGIGLTKQLSGRERRTMYGRHYRRS